MATILMYSKHDAIERDAIPLAFVQAPSVRPLPLRQGRRLEVPQNVVEQGQKRPQSLMPGTARDIQRDR
jgi:hypothetical protein